MRRRVLSLYLCIAHELSDDMAQKDVAHKRRSGLQRFVGKNNPLLLIKLSSFFQDGGTLTEKGMQSKCSFNVYKLVEPWLLKGIMLFVVFLSFLYYYHGRCPY